MNKKKVMLPAVFILGMLLIFSGLILADNETNGTDGNSTLTLNETNSTFGNETNNTFENETNSTFGNLTNSTVGNVTNNTLNNETEGEIDNETENEIEVMKTTSVGAKMRLLQLERKIGIKIFEMQTIIDYIQNNTQNGTDVNSTENSTVNNTADLESILAELKTLNSSISNISSENKTEAVQSFVDIKLRARELVKEFREKALTLLNENDKRSLRALFIEIEKNHLKGLKDKIREKEKELWKEEVRRVLEKMGKGNNGLLERIDGEENITAEDIRSHLKGEYGNLSSEERDEARLKLREYQKERNEEIKEALREAEKKRLERFLGRR
ncbi:MAG: hypothetical protein Q8Q04_03800 [archaeon]|nr:hypothetical protein [archaeon]